MIAKELEQITEGDLDALVENAVAEGKTIDYKLKLPGNSDADRKEFLADVSSFANTVGGDLVFGVEEKEGVPIGLPGVTAGDLDLEIRRLDSIITDGLEPRIRHAARAVPYKATRVLVIRVERSWTGPHRVIYKGHDKFYGRNSAGKFSLDVDQLRAAFTSSTTLNQQIRAFRTDRIIALSNNDTPISFLPGAKIVMHFLPVDSFGVPLQYDYMQFYRDPTKLPPLGASGWSHRVNLEGMMTFSGDQTASYSYTQVYRTGILEVVDGSTLAEWGDRKNIIPSVAYEDYILRYFGTCTNTLKQLGVAPPVVFALTLTNVRGYRMSGNDLWGFERPQSINVDTLMLPETVIDNLDVRPSSILVPLFNLVWNACGYPKSKNFDEVGNWIQRR